MGRLHRRSQRGGVEVGHRSPPPSGPVTHQLHPPPAGGDRGLHRPHQPGRIGLDGEAREVAPFDRDHAAGGLEVGSGGGRQAGQGHRHRVVVPALVEHEEDATLQAGVGASGNRGGVTRIEVQLVGRQMGVSVGQTGQGPPTVSQLRGARSSRQAPDAGGVDLEEPGWCRAGRAKRHVHPSPR